MTPSTSQLLRDIKTDPQLAREFQQDPEKALKDYQLQNPKEWDNWIYRLVVLAIGLTLITIVFGSIVILITGQITEKDIRSKDFVTLIASLGSAAIGALAGLLAPSPKANP